MEKKYRANAANGFYLLIQIRKHLQEDYRMLLTEATRVYLVKSHNIFAIGLLFRTAFVQFSLFMRRYFEERNSSLDIQEEIFADVKLYNKEPVSNLQSIPFR